MRAAIPVGAAVLAGLGAVLGWLRRRYAVVDVDGASMEPTYRSGDRVLVRRTRLPGIHRGDVVVAERPDRPERWPSRPGRRIHGRAWMIKRVAALPGDPVPDEVAGAGVPAGSVVPAGRLVLLGDNPAGSLDSRGYGYFPAERVLGAVVRQLP